MTSLEDPSSRRSPDLGAKHERRSSAGPTDGDRRLPPLAGRSGTRRFFVQNCAKQDRAELFRAQRPLSAAEADGLGWRASSLEWLAWN